MRRFCSCEACSVMGFRFDRLWAARQYAAKVRARNPQMQVKRIAPKSEAFIRDLLFLRRNASY